MQDIAVIGLGIFGYEIAVQLEEKGHRVMAIDIDPVKIERIKNLVTAAIIADITDEAALKELHLSKFAVVILGLGSNFEQLVLGVEHLKRLEVKSIKARATTEIQQQILLKLGADEVILPEKHTAIHLAERITTPNVLEYLKLDDEMELAEIKVDPEMAGKNLAQLNWRQLYNVTALVLKRPEQKTKVITAPTDILQEEDQVLVVGKKEDIKKIFAKQ